MIGKIVQETATREQVICAQYLWFHTMWGLIYSGKIIHLYIY